MCDLVQFVISMCYVRLPRRDVLVTTATRIANGVSVANSSARARAAMADVLAGSGPLDEVQAYFRAGLGIAPPPAPPPLPLSWPAEGAPLGLILGVTLSVAASAVVGLAVFVYVVLRHRHQWRPRRVQAGEFTTLLVTDIVDSTVLWEALSEGEMGAALATHNGLVRRLLEDHQGYEQATEGDSFLLAVSWLVVGQGRMVGCAGGCATWQRSTTATRLRPGATRSCWQAVGWLVVWLAKGAWLGVRVAARPGSEARRLRDCDQTRLVPAGGEFRIPHCC
eukprot:361758-Chlamydomonas_euryale.AAC.11